jgi:lysophospholipase L1-like esterase
MKLKNGDVILFEGDSITDCGRDRGDFYSLSGYSEIVANTLSAFCPEKGIRVFNRGAGGDKICDLLKRIKKNAEELKPTVISLLIGVNNVWRNEDLDDVFEREYRALLDICKKATDRIVLIELFIIPSFADRVVLRPRMDSANVIIRKLAAEYKTEYIPMDGIFAELSVKNGAALYSEDGVHPTGAGQIAIATEWLKRISE